MEEANTQSSNHEQVQVYFTTNSEDLKLAEEKRYILVPTHVQRYGLSQILNSELMLNTSTTIPFDFLINGNFLRTSLEEYLLANGISSETTLTLQYVRSLIPPSFEASFEHDDWVSSVDVLSGSSVSGSWGANFVDAGKELILSGSYDGLLRIWNKSGQIVSTSDVPVSGVHTSSIKTAKFISPTQIASAGFDRSLKIWEYTRAEDEFSGKLKLSLELYGHKGSIETIDVHGPSSRVLSGSTDGSIGIWTIIEKDAPEATPGLFATEPIAKRRRVAESKSTPKLGPLSFLYSNTGPVSAVIFNPADPTVSYSASLDHSLRTFDIPTSTLVDTRTTLNPLLSLAALPGISSQVLAAGTSARHVIIVDPRVSSTTTQLMTLRGHTNKIVSIAPDPESNYGLVTGSHDGTCRVWDLRSSRQGTKNEGGGNVGDAVYVIERQSKLGRRPIGGEGIKVFSVQWDKEVGMVSGGEDKKVQINHGRDISRSNL